MVFKIFYVNLVVGICRYDSKAKELIRIGSLSKNMGFLFHPRDFQRIEEERKQVLGGDGLQPLMS